MSETLFCKLFEEFKYVFYAVVIAASDGLAALMKQYGPDLVGVPIGDWLQFILGIIGVALVALGAKRSPTAKERELQDSAVNAQILHAKVLGKTLSKATTGATSNEK